MTTARRNSRMILLGVVGLALATMAGAQVLPRLPEEFIFPAVDGSPGQVKFVHRTHLEGRRADCTTCHPGLFKILSAGATADGATMGHEPMDEGRHCGACHNDKAVFGFGESEKCLACHSVSGSE